MEITIGVKDVGRELIVNSEQSQDEVTKLVRKALADQSNVLELIDDRGARIMVPTATIGYVQIGTEAPRRVGFGSE